MKGVIIGKFQRSYPDKSTGEQKISREIAVIWEKKGRLEDNCEGQKAETIFVTFPINDLHVGDVCEFDYDINSTSKGTFARLVDITKVGQVKVMFQDVAAPASPK